MTEAIYVIDGKEFSFSIRENLELKKNFLYLKDIKIFDTFHRGCSIINGKAIFNDVDITPEGKKMFKVPVEYTTHFTSVTIGN